MPLTSEELGIKIAFENLVNKTLSNWQQSDNDATNNPMDSGASAQPVVMQYVDNQGASTSSIDDASLPSMESTEGTQFKTLSMPTLNELIHSINYTPTNNPIDLGASAQPVATEFTDNQEASTSSIDDALLYSFMESEDNIEFDENMLELQNLIQSSNNNIVYHPIDSNTSVQPVATESTNNHVTSTSSINAPFPTFLESIEESDSESTLNDSMQSGNYATNNPMDSDTSVQSVAKPVAMQSTNHQVASTSSASNVPLTFVEATDGRKLYKLYIPILNDSMQSGNYATNNSMDSDTSVQPVLKKPKNIQEVSTSNAPLPTFVESIEESDSESTLNDSIQSGNYATKKHTYENYPQLVLRKSKNNQEASTSSANDAPLRTLVELEEERKVESILHDLIKSGNYATKKHTYENYPQLVLRKSKNNQEASTSSANDAPLRTLVELEEERKVESILHDLIKSGNYATKKHTYENYPQLVLRKSKNNQEASTSSASFPSVQSTDDIDFDEADMSSLSDLIQSANDVTTEHAYAKSFPVPIAPQSTYNQQASTSSASFPSVQSTDDIDFDEADMSSLSDLIQSANDVKTEHAYAKSFPVPIAPQSTYNQQASTSIASNVPLPIFVELAEEREVESTLNDSIQSDNDTSTNKKKYVHSGKPILIKSKNNQEASKSSINAILSSVKPIAPQYAYNQGASIRNTPLPSVESTKETEFEELEHQRLVDWNKLNNNNVVQNQIDSNTSVQHVATESADNQEASTSNTNDVLFPSVESTDDIELNNAEETLEWKNFIASVDDFTNNPMYSGAFAQSFPVPVAQQYVDNQVASTSTIDDVSFPSFQSIEDIELNDKDISLLSSIIESANYYANNPMYSGAFAQPVAQPVATEYEDNHVSSTSNANDAIFPSVESTDDIALNNAEETLEWKNFIASVDDFTNNPMYSGAFAQSFAVPFETESTDNQEASTSTIDDALFPSFATESTNTQQASTRQKRSFMDQYDTQSKRQRTSPSVSNSFVHQYKQSTVTSDTNNTTRRY